MFNKKLRLELADQRARAQRSELLLSCEKNYNEYHRRNNPRDFAEKLAVVYPELFVAYKRAGGYVTGPYVGEQFYNYEQFILDVEAQAEVVRKFRLDNERMDRLAGADPEHTEKEE